MTKSNFKICPECSRLAPLGATCCLGCRHLYRTRFERARRAPLWLLWAIAGVVVFALACWRPSRADFAKWVVRVASARSGPALGDSPMSSELETLATSIFESRTVECNFIAFTYYRTTAFDGTSYAAMGAFGKLFPLNS